MNMSQEEINVVINEVEQQRAIMGSRAAEYARQLYIAQEEVRKLKEQLAKLTANGHDEGQANG